VKGSAIENKNELFLGTINELRKISREALEAVSEKSLLRLDRCINRNGEYRVFIIDPDSPHTNEIRQTL
jgi:hypothetical protein